MRHVSRFFASRPAAVRIHKFQVRDSLSTAMYARFSLKTALHVTDQTPQLVKPVSGWTGATRPFEYLDRTASSFSGF